MRKISEKITDYPEFIIEKYAKDLIQCLSIV
jgi:hypothetical protein